MRKCRNINEKRIKIWNLVNLRSIFGEFLVEYGFGKFPFWLLRKLRGKESKAKERRFKKKK